MNLPPSFLNSPLSCCSIKFTFSGPSLFLFRPESFAFCSLDQVVVCEIVFSRHSMPTPISKANDPGHPMSINAIDITTTLFNCINNAIPYLVYTRDGSVGIDSRPMRQR